MSVGTSASRPTVVPRGRCRAQSAQCWRGDVRVFGSPAWRNALVARCANVRRGTVGVPYSSPPRVRPGALFGGRDRPQSDVLLGLRARFAGPGGARYGVRYGAPSLRAGRRLLRPNCATAQCQAGTRWGPTTARVSWASTWACGASSAVYRCASPPQGDRREQVPVEYSKIARSKKFHAVAP